MLFRHIIFKLPVSPFSLVGWLLSFPGCRFCMPVDHTCFLNYRTIKLYILDYKTSLETNNGTHGF